MYYTRVMAMDARHRFRWSSARTACGAVLAAAALAGCVRREIEVTSTPPGALLTLNGREIGRTPAKVQFTFDGTYDVRLKLSGYESVEGKGTTDMPVWDFMGADLVAEVVPVGLERHEHWHFDMVPEGDAEANLHDRAAAARNYVNAMPATVADAPPPAAPTATPEGKKQKKQ